MFAECPPFFSVYTPGFSSPALSSVTLLAIRHTTYEQPLSIAFISGKKIFHGPYGSFSLLVPRWTPA